VRRPQPVLADVKFKKVSCAGFHSLGVDVENNMYAWGRSDNARCGIEMRRHEQDVTGAMPIWEPTKVNSFGKVKAIAAGGFMSVAIDLDGKELLCVGGNENGELGGGKTSKFESNPVVPLLSLEHDEILSDVSCGGFHTAVLTSFGRVIGFGDNHSYQLGSFSDDTSVYAKKRKLHEVTPIEIRNPSDSPIVQISCGPTFTLLATKSNQVWLIGGSPSSQKPQLIYESQTPVWLPEKQGAHHLMFMVDEP
jgi:alpha-tubulin suppressor-like RCC1 family protein